MEESVKQMVPCNKIASKYNMYNIAHNYMFRPIFRHTLSLGYHTR